MKALLVLVGMVLGLGWGVFAEGPLSELLATQIALCRSQIKIYQRDEEDLMQRRSNLLRFQTELGVKACLELKAEEGATFDWTSPSPVCRKPVETK